MPDDDVADMAEAASTVRMVPATCDGYRPPVMFCSNAAADAASGTTTLLMTWVLVPVEPEVEDVADEVE